MLGLAKSTQFAVQPVIDATEGGGLAPFVGDHDHAWQRLFPSAWDSGRYARPFPVAVGSALLGIFTACAGPAVMERTVVPLAGVWSCPEVGDLVVVDLGHYTLPATDKWGHFEIDLQHQLHFQDDGPLRGEMGRWDPDAEQLVLGGPLNGRPCTRLEIGLLDRTIGPDRDIPYRLLLAADPRYEKLTV